MSSLSVVLGIMLWFHTRQKFCHGFEECTVVTKTLWKLLISSSPNFPDVDYKCIAMITLLKFTLIMAMLNGNLCDKSEKSNKYEVGKVRPDPKDSCRLQ